MSLREGLLDHKKNSVTQYPAALRGWMQKRCPKEHYNNQNLNKGNAQKFLQLTLSYKGDIPIGVF